jgi:cyclopropane-fatty-acyl-phospholipid synthase
MRFVLNAILGRFIAVGRLNVIWPDGQRTTCEGAPGPEATVRFETWRAVNRLVSDPALALGEEYMDSGVTPVGCSIFELLNLLSLNRASAPAGHPVMALRERLDIAMRRIRQLNTPSRARRNAAHHYDLNGRLYSLFLDRDRQYSCAYFPRGDETIDEAQAAKKRHIAAKLLLDRPDLTVLDIGCGWGGIALALARDYGARVTGITLSSEQLAEARARAEAEGLADRVRFELLDYRAVDRPYDRIVSVGMFEHVGLNHYGEFFTTMRRCLHPDGVGLLHAIGRSDGPAATNPWFAKYIFPGGYSPALSEVLPAVEPNGLIVTDIEILRLHYAETLRHWRRRFAANRDAIAAIYDERFCRMFEFYLAGAELAFRNENHMVFQIQMARHQAAVPLTRDYIASAEARAPRVGVPAHAD